MPTDARHDLGPGTRLRWRLPGPVLVALVAAPAVAATVWALVVVPPGGHDLGLAALFLVLELASTALARQDRGSAGGLTAVWAFAGALLLPPGVAALLAAALLARTRGWRDGPYRFVHTTATMMLSCLTASVALIGLPGAVPWVFPGAALVPATVAGLIVVVVERGLVALSVPRQPLRALSGRREENMLAFATLSLGALTAAAVSLSVWLAPLVLPAMMVLHRASLLPELEHAATVDGKTGLLNASTWHRLAEEALAADEPGAAGRAVLVIDLDHFKAINDTFGHLAGDVVLAAVADALTAMVRAHDLVGRFGGEEFVVLLSPPAGPAEVRAVGERIRGMVAALRVTVSGGRDTQVLDGLRVSIGGAVQRPSSDPRHRGGLAELLALADEALYAAKRSGRDQVRVRSLAAAPAPRHPIVAQGDNNTS